MAQSRIVVVGAGVSGLTTALRLATPSCSVTVVAKHMPGDLSIDYASPWAGANILPISEPGSAAEAWDRATWPVFARLASDVPEAGVHFQDTRVYNRAEDAGAGAEKNPWAAAFRDSWAKDMFPNYRALPKEELLGHESGVGFTSVCINVAIYLPWLLSQCLKAGVVLKRGIVSHISEAAALHHSGSPAEVIVNCTGLASGTLGGIEDKQMVPVRGQTVLVRNDPGVMLTTSSTEEGNEETLYIMQRAAGGGTILGGSYQKGAWSAEIDHNIAARIMKRAVDICPALTGGKGVEHLSVIRHNVGLRPLRLSGVRLEKEQIGGVWTVHNYGHGGFGYQASYGCAETAVRLVEEVLGAR